MCFFWIVFFLDMFAQFCFLSGVVLNTRSNLFFLDEPVLQDSKIL